MGSHIVYICCVRISDIMMINCSIFDNLTNVKQGKEIPSQAWTGPEVSRR